MPLITIGSEASDRGSTEGANYTILLKDSPATRNVIVTTVELFNDGSMQNIKVGSFYGSGTSWTNRAYASLGNTASFPAKRTYTGLSIQFMKDDLIGIYFSAAAIQKDLTGYAGILKKSGDVFGGGAETYSLTENETLSLCGFGVIVDGSPMRGGFNGMRGGFIN